MTYIAAVHGVVFARRQSPLCVYDWGACPAHAARGAKGQLEERGGIFDGKSDRPFPSDLIMPRNFWRPVLAR